MDERSTSALHPSGCAGLVAVATAAAIVSVPIAWATDLLRALPVVMGVTMFIALAVGLPILIALRDRGGVSWRSVVKGGFVTGAVVPALLSLLLLAQIIGGTTTIGDKTEAWAGFVAFVGVPGLAGILGAFITWRLIDWLSADQASAFGRSWRIGSGRRCDLRWCGGSGPLCRSFLPQSIARRPIVDRSGGRFRIAGADQRLAGFAPRIASFYPEQKLVVPRLLTAGPGHGVVLRECLHRGRNADWNCLCRRGRRWRPVQRLPTARRRQLETARPRTATATRTALAGEGCLSVRAICPACSAMADRCFGFRPGRVSPGWSGCRRC